jgi:hypothetical protein
MLMMKINLMECAVLLIALAVVAAMSGCAGVATKPAAEIVQVPVMVPCLGPEVPEPVWQAAGHYPGDAAAVKALGADLVRAKDWAVQLAARMAGCR